MKNNGRRSQQGKNGHTDEAEFVSCRRESDVHDPTLTFEFCQHLTIQTMTFDTPPTRISVNRTIDYYFLLTSSIRLPPPCQCIPYVLYLPEWSFFEGGVTGVAINLIEIGRDHTASEVSAASGNYGVVGVPVYGHHRGFVFGNHLGDPPVVCFLESVRMRVPMDHFVIVKTHLLCIAGEWWYSYLQIGTLFAPLVTANLLPV